MESSNYELVFELEGDGERVVANNSGEECGQLAYCSCHMYTFKFNCWLLSKSA